MLTRTSSRLFRRLLSLAIRLRLSVDRIILTLRALFALLWRSILTCPRLNRRNQPHVRLHANDVPVVDNNPTGERLQVSEREKVEGEDQGTFTTLPAPWRATRWQDELSRYQALTSSYQFNFERVPATPEKASQRYWARTVSRDAKSPSILPGQQQFLSTSPLGDGWRQYVHPEGNLLFCHEGLRIFTEYDITDHKKEKEVLFCATTLIEQAIRTNGVILDEFTEIVLNMDDTRRWHYYFVDHSHRLLFWVDQVSVHDLGTHLQGITKHSHIRYLVESQYWYASSCTFSGMPTPFAFYSCISYIDVASRSHCEYYPHSRTLPKGVFEDLRGMLNYAKTDMMTTDSSSSPFAQDELVAILDIVNSLKDDEKIDDPYSIWVIARLMTFFTENQFLNFYGQPCARLNADTPLFGQQTWNCRIEFKVVNWLLFGSPNDHAVRLQRIWVDGMIIQPRWKDYVNRLTVELGRYTIFSTVMLAVNFSFLAVPGVVNPSSTAGAVQIIICCSVVSTTASIVFSFALVNVYSNPGLLVAGPAAEAMRTLNRNKTGMACLAVTHSLPIASLMWSITLFSAALVVQIFGPKERATVTTLGVECLIIVLFGAVGFGVMRLFSGNDDVGDLDTSAEQVRPLASSQCDVELGTRE